VLNGRRDLLLRRLLRALGPVLFRVMKVEIEVSAAALLHHLALGLVAVMDETRREILGAFCP
jgi:hypothetical protein